MKPAREWWWVLFEHDGRRKILAYIEPNMPVETVRAMGVALANDLPEGLVDLGAWPRRNNRFGHNGLLALGFEKMGLLTPTAPEKTE